MAGAGGGLILLIVLLQFVDPIVAIPLHGVIQFVSNGSRAFTLRGDVESGILRWYLLPLVPSAVVGFFIADGVPVGAAQIAIGVFALLATWWPKATSRLAPAAGQSQRRFMVVGAVGGLTNPTLGAPGPLLAPAFRAATATHVEMIATFSVAQLCNHGAKVAVFAVAGVAWSEHWELLAVAGAGVIAGTSIGTRHMRRADQVQLRRLFVVAVTVGALRLIAKPLL